jgi:predicted transcriptional regulator
MATITLQILDELNAALEALSARRHVPKSAIVRAALEEALAREEETANAAAHWVAAWRGCLRGKEAPATDDARLAHLLNKHLC